MLELQLPWTKCLPLALLRIRTCPRKDVGISSYEMMFGIPYTGSVGMPRIELKDIFLRKFIQGLSQCFSSLRSKGLLAQTPPFDFHAHDFKSGDWVLIKQWRALGKLRPIWDGPFQVLLTTESAVRTREQGWIHHSRVKGPVDPALVPGRSKF
uniref:Murine leukemia virus integrase C-terminal domain-containing protein n=1 Tax=Micrurus lemniscatus lemniscatus TaxID=129467 RepID=A0A2D4I7A6_MICLE